MSKQLTCSGSNFSSSVTDAEKSVECDDSWSCPAQEASQGRMSMIRYQAGGLLPCHIRMYENQYTVGTVLFLVPVVSI